MEAADASQLKAFDPAAAGAAAGAPVGTLPAFERIEQQRVEGKLAKARMTLVRRNAQLVLALIFQPGLDGKPKEKADALKTLFADTNAAAARVAEIFGGGLQDKGWLAEMAAPIAAEWVANRWYASGHSDIRAEIDAIAALFPDINDLVRETEPKTRFIPNSEAEVHAALRLSLLKASEDLMQEAMQCPLGHPDGASVFCALQDKIADRCLSHAIPKDFDALPREVRVQLMQNYMNAAARVMCTEYRRAVAEWNNGATPFPLARIVERWTMGIDVLDRTVEVNLGEIRNRISNQPKSETNKGVPQP